MSVRIVKQGFEGITVRQLEGLGYRALQAPDGPVALAILADSSNIDLLLSDVVLPGGMNGPEIYRQTKDQHSDLRCVFMSGYAATLEGKLPGGADLLSKPIDIAELHAPFSHQELVLREALGLGDAVTINASGGALAANAILVAGLARIGEASRQIWAGEGRRAIAHATSGPCLQQNLVCVLEGE